MKKISVIVNSY